MAAGAAGNGSERPRATEEVGAPPPPAATDSAATKADAASAPAADSAPVVADSASVPFADSTQARADSAAFAPQEIPFPRPFAVGEALTFSLQYGPIKAGVARLMVEEIETIDGRACYRFTSTARSVAFFSAFYKVDDRIESYLDVNTLITHRTRKRLREGDYRLDQDVEWDHGRGVLTYNDGSTPELVRGARDVLGAMYFVRTLPLRVGDAIPIDTHDSKKSYPLIINVLREERIDTPVGSFDCLVVEPKLQTSGLFRRSGSLVVWVTQDERRLPVKMESRIKVGAVSAILTGIEYGDPATALGLGAVGLGAN